MPVGIVALGKCPAKLFDAQPARDQRIVVDVLVVVIVDEAVADSLTKYEPDGQHQQAANGQPTGGGRKRGTGTFLCRTRRAVPAKGACSFSARGSLRSVGARVAPGVAPPAAERSSAHSSLPNRSSTSFPKQAHTTRILVESGAFGKGGREYQKRNPSTRACLTIRCQSSGREPYRSQEIGQGRSAMPAAYSV